MADGVGTLKNGSSELSSNSDKILAGIGTLSSGTDQLYSGAKKLQNEGLNKLAKEGDSLISSLDGAMEVKDKLLDAAKGYDNFTGISDSMDGSVKFVMKVKAEDSNKEKASDTKNDDTKKVDSNESSSSNFIDWIKSKFNK